MLKYNPMSIEFQNEAKRLGLSGNQYHQKLIEEGILPRTIDIFIRHRDKRIERFEKDTVNYCEKFVKAISPSVPWLKKQIYKSKRKEITIKIKEIKYMIKQFENIKNNELYYGLKLALFLEGIVLDLAENNGDWLLIMRMGSEDDILPNPLNEFLNIYLNNKLKNINMEN